MTPEALSPVVSARSLWPTPESPYLRSGQTFQQMLASWSLSAVVVALSGAVLYGMAAIRVVAVAVLAGAASELVMAVATQRRAVVGFRHAVLTGLLLSLTLPPTVPWFVPCVGSIAAVVVATWMFGGFGHYLWQPAVVGRVLVQFLFSQYLSFGQAIPMAPILAPGYLLTGELSAVDSYPPGRYLGWEQTPVAPRVEAFLVERPVQTLRRIANGDIPIMSDTPLTVLLRDYLPPWDDTVAGTVPGGIGESCSIALIVVGLYLIYRGHLRWQVPVIVLAAAAVAATVLPIMVMPTRGEETFARWFPGLSVEAGRPVGPLYVLYHLTSGQLLLGAFLLAGDLLASPLTSRGQALYAAGIGALTIFMRLYGVVEGECYWSILIMNTCIPAIDRRTRRRPLGFPA